MKSGFSRGIPLRARAYDFLCSYVERRGLREWRQVLVGDLSSDVVELGAGTGRNFRFYSPDATVFASDIDPLMLTRARERAVRADASVRLFLADAMRLPLDDDSVETVVVGLMLCSVPDQERTIAEIRRVLKPSGTLRFVEHVRAADARVLAKVQDVTNPAWRVVMGGCNCNRRTADRVRAAGFTLERLHEFDIGFGLTAPHVMGVARLD